MLSFKIKLPRAFLAPVAPFPKCRPQIFPLRPSRSLHNRSLSAVPFVCSAPVTGLPFQKVQVRNFGKKNKKKIAKSADSATFQMVDVVGNRKGSFSATRPFDPEKLEAQFLKKMGMQPEALEDGQVQYLDPEMQEWQDVAFIDELDANVNEIEMRYEQFDGDEGPDEDPDDYDEDEDYEDFMRSETGQSRKPSYNEVLAELVSKCTKHKFDALRATSSEVRNFVLKAAKDSEQLRTAIIAEPDALDHITTCLQYDFVHDEFSSDASQGSESDVVDV